MLKLVQHDNLELVIRRQRSANPLTTLNIIVI